MQPRTCENPDNYIYYVNRLKWRPTVQSGNFNSSKKHAAKRTKILNGDGSENISTKNNVPSLSPVLINIFQQSNQISGKLHNRNITICGRRTSLRLEPTMWQALIQIADRECCTIHEICTAAAKARHPDSTVTAAVRAFIVNYYVHLQSEKPNVWPHSAI
ncbi:MAG: hypothetical protein GC191_18445 [Azospirillum sp.]|nr:hypothetical protein [Azospirillum sp.]